MRGGCPDGGAAAESAQEATTASARVHQGVQARCGQAVRSSGQPIAHIARELGIYDSTLGNWVRQDAIDRGEREGLTSEERERLRTLEAENAKLRMERDLLKRTVAFWVKETSTP
jgi:transposase